MRDAHRGVAVLGPGVDLLDAVLGGPGQGDQLEVHRESAAAPVTAYGGEGVLGTGRLVGVEPQPGAPDHLAVVEGEEHRVAQPRARPPLRGDLERGVDGEVGERLEAEALVGGLPQSGALLRGDDLDAVGCGGRLDGAGEAVGLLDLAVDLLEAEPAGEGERSVVVGSRAHRRVAQTRHVVDQALEQCGAVAASAVLGQHPRDHAAGLADLRAVGHPGPHDHAVLARHDEQPLRRLVGPDLRDRLGALVGDHRDPHPTPRLEVVVGDAGADVEGHGGTLSRSPSIVQWVSAGGLVTGLRPSSTSNRSALP